MSRERWIKRRKTEAHLETGSKSLHPEKEYTILIWATILLLPIAAAHLPPSIPSHLQCPRKLSHTFCFVVNNSSKVVNAKLCFVVILRGNVVGIKLVLRVQLV